MTDKDDLAGSKTPETLETRQPPKSLLELLAQLREQGADKVEQSRAVERYLRYQAAKDGIPRFGKFDLTPLCNLDCKMCYVHLNREQLRTTEKNGIRILTISQWKSLMQQALDAGMQYAALSGGECLTYPGFDELYLFLISHGARVTVMTNAVLLKEKIPLFVKYPPRKIQVTIYGSNEDDYEKVTGYKSFEKVLNAVLEAKQAKLPLNIGITPSIFIEENVIELLRLVDSLNIPYSINPSLFEPYSSTGKTEGWKRLDMSKENYLKLYHFRASLNGKSVIPKCEEELPPVHEKQGSPITVPDNSADKDIIRGLRCGAGRNSFTINWDGRMSPCNSLHCEPLYPLITGFLNCWKCVNEFAENYPRPLECEGCAYEKVCFSCVVQHAYGAPPGHANPSICEWGKRLVAEGLSVI